MTSWRWRLSMLGGVILLLTLAGCAGTVDLAPPPATTLPDLRGVWTGAWGGAPMQLVISEQVELGDYSGLSFGPLQLLGRRRPGISGVMTSTIAGAPVSVNVHGWLGYSNGKLTLLLHAETPSGLQRLTLIRASDDRWRGEGGSSFSWGPQGAVEIVRQPAPGTGS